MAEGLGLNLTVRKDLWGTDSSAGKDHGLPKHKIKIESGATNFAEGAEDKPWLGQAHPRFWPNP